MRTLKLPVWIVTLWVALLAIPPVRADLYGDDAKNATSGELNDQDYWWAKFDDMMLALAIKQRQPEGKIGLNLASSIRRLDDLVKKFPKHEEIRKMKQHADEVNGKISPDASRGGSFNPGCPWEEANFAQLWVNLHWARTAVKANDSNTALSCMQNVMQNYAIMLKPDRMKDYPEDLRKWVMDSKAEADALHAKVKAKR
jgi:hypothetical protein